MSARDFLRLLRVLQPRLPVALLGAAIRPEDWGREVADAHFPKPFDLNRFLGWIGDCLTQRSAGSRDGLLVMIGQSPVRHLEIVRRVLEFIEGRLREGIPVAAVARAAGVSRSYLCRIFKRVTGDSVKRFLTRRRLQAAKALLRERGVTIHQVACRVGYRDLAHFDRVFRRWEGQTPSAYRRQAIMAAARTRGSTTPVPSCAGLA